MYSVSDNCVYYLVDRLKGITTEIGDYKHLISYLAGYTGDTAYSAFDFSGNDKMETPVKKRGYKTVWSWKTTDEGETVSVPEQKYGLWIYYEMLPKPYMIVDSYGRIVDVRLFEDDIQRERQKSPKRYWKRFNGTKAGTKLYSSTWRSRNVPFWFRRGAVPGIHEMNYGDYTSKSQRAQNLKKAALLRPKVRISAADLWDRKIRHRDRNWKSSFKCRHQWEKHLIRRNGSENAYVMRRFMHEPEDDMLFDWEDFYEEIA